MTDQPADRCPAEHPYLLSFEGDYLRCDLPIGHVGDHFVTISHAGLEHRHRWSNTVTEPKT